MSSVTPGRTCPLSYGYPPAAIGERISLHVDTLWIAGGLYGNPLALHALLESYEAERGSKALVFNGDFHWFDVDPADFRLIDKAVAKFDALRGNVETELAVPGDGAGCGCAYPEWVGDATVEHSNRIIERLRTSAQSAGIDLERLAALPMQLAARVGNLTIGVVHGDASSLAGWGFSQEALATPEGSAQAERAFADAHVDIFASSHTCLPVVQRFASGNVLINNGAAGMPNFRGTAFGLVSRISIRPSTNALYSTCCDGLYVEAVPLHYDERAWQQRFLAQWPPGSAAHRSYWDRICAGPGYEIDRALRLR